MHIAAATYWIGTLFSIIGAGVESPMLLTFGLCTMGFAVLGALLEVLREWERR